jgi:hypothetical protein
MSHTHYAYKRSPHPLSDAHLTTLGASPLTFFTLDARFDTCHAIHFNFPPSRTFTFVC